MFDRLRRRKVLDSSAAHFQLDKASDVKHCGYDFLRDYGNRFDTLVMFERLGRNMKNAPLRFEE